MKKLLMAAVLLFSMSLFVFQACKKDNTSSDSDTVTAEDNATSENMFADAFNVVDESIREDGRLQKTDGGNIINSCAAVTIDTTAKPWKMTIDFGTGCTGNDGRTRKGKILVTLSGRYRNPGTVITIGFENYYVNDIKVEGAKTVTNMGLNSKGNLYYKIQVRNAKLSFTDGTAITWQSDREREWTDGSGTASVLDDAYLVTGSASGTNRRGESYTATVGNPLKIKIGCRWIESGTITISPAGKSDRLIDYGNGDCDNKATVTINGKTYNISLR